MTIAEKIKAQSKHIQDTIFTDFGKDKPVCPGRPPIACYDGEMLGNPIFTIKFGANQKSRYVKFLAWCANNSFMVLSTIPATYETKIVFMNEGEI